MARAAERLLERKRMGLESVIEALETVGYAVTLSADGRYTVTPPMGNGTTPTVPAEAPEPKARFTDYVMGRNDIEADAGK